MMETLLSRENINDKVAFNVHLTGGSPWGFTLHGGREFNSKLCISKITPGGKADLSKELQVGDEVVAINSMECSSRAEAIEQVRCSRQRLNLTIRRENSKQNGFQGRTNEYHPIPNLYKTALEVAVEPNDFYKTYSVDPTMYKRIALHSKDSGASWTRHDDIKLSASNEDLLESYRNQGSIVGSDEALDRDRGMKSSFTNGRISPEEKHKENRIPPVNRQLINTLHSRAKSWSEHRGQSLPENQLHKRTYTLPDHIQKVKIRSANISSSSSIFTSPENDGRQQSRISPAKHSPITKQNRLTESVYNAEDDWVDRWLRNDKHSVSPEENVSVKDVRSKFEEGNNRAEENQQSDPPSSPVQNKSNFSRSKSFSGRPSYGVVFGTTAVKSKDHSQITAFQAPLPPARYSSSDLLKDKARPGLAPADSWQSSTISLPVDVEFPSRKVTTIHEEKNQPLELRLSRKSLGSMPMVSSTSSLETIGSSDRRQGPAPPPRRSESKLLSSFRLRGKRMHPHTVSSGTTRDQLKSHVRNENPKHVSSKSWPSDHLGNELHTLPSKVSQNRQSWHSQEPTDKHDQPSKTSPTGLKCSSSVVISSVRTSTSASEDTSFKPKIYRTASLELQPPADTFEAARPHNARGLVQPAQEIPWNLQQEAQSLSNKIEDTQILQRLMKDNEVNTQPASVKSRIQSFEKSSSHPNLLEEPDVSQLKSRSNHPKQRSWDHTYTTSERMSPNITKADAWARGRMASPDDKHVHTSPEGAATSKSHGKQAPAFSSNEKEAGSTPIKVTSMVKELEKSESPMRLPARVSYDIEDETFPNKSSPTKIKGELCQPVMEKITRTQSTSLQEKEIFMEEMFKRLEDDNTANISSNKLDESNNNLFIHRGSSHKTSIYSVGDDEVFSGATDDDFLLPPPPPSYLETSQDNLPFPTPPRELLGEDCSLRAEIVSKDRERHFIEVKAVEHTIPKLESPRLSDISLEKKRLSYSGEKADAEKNVSSEKAISEDSPRQKGNVENEDSMKYAIEKSLEEEGNIEVLKAKNTRNHEIRLEKESHESREDIDFIKTESRPDDTNLYENEYPSGQSTEMSLESSKTEHGSTTKSPPPPPLVITSTPTSPPREDNGSSPDNDMAGNTSPFSGSSLSTPSSSRPGSMVSPKLEALDKEKGQLIESMKKKIEDLKTQMNEITDEIEENEKLGEKVAAQLEGKTTPSELSKYQRFTGELNKIVLLLLSLTQRMHRYENTLQELDMSEEADRQQRDILLDKIEHVKAQYQEACKIKEVNDQRGEVVSKFLENYLNEDEFADFQYYIDMKTQLALMHAEIRDKVKMGEERLNALTTTSIDWNTLSLCN